MPPRLSRYRLNRSCRALFGLQHPRLKQSFPQHRHLRSWHCWRHTNVANSARTGGAGAAGKIVLTWDVVTQITLDKSGLTCTGKDVGAYINVQITTDKGA